MYLIDLVVAVLLSFAVWNGFRRGLILQICGLVGLCVSIWLAAQFNEQVGAMLHIDPQFAAAGGFAVVFLLSMILFSLLGHILRKIFKAAGLSMTDHVLGMGLCLAKYLLVLSILFSTFAKLNQTMELVSEAKLKESYTYYPISKISTYLLPMVRWIGLQLPEGDDETENI